VVTGLVLCFGILFNILGSTNPIARSLTISEHELVAQLKARKTAALDYLYDHYSAALNGVISRIISNEDLAEEVLQDAFLKIWEKIASYDETKGKLFTWMLNVSRNLAIDKMRSKEISKGRKTDDLQKLVSKVDNQEFVESQVEAIGLKEVLLKLPAEQRFVVEKVYLGGFTHAELAEEYRIPLGTVKTRLRMAMTELRTILEVS
jgi:RNA polymerase sigma factor (sigma-70 family)